MINMTKNSKQKKRALINKSVLEEVVAIKSSINKGNNDLAYRQIIAALFEREGLCQTLLTRIDELEKIVAKRESE